MLKEFYNAFPLVTNDVINEAIKLEHNLEKLKEWLSDFNNSFSFTGGYVFIHEYEINKPEFIGFVDLIVKEKVRMILQSLTLNTVMRLKNIKNHLNYKYISTILNKRDITL